MPARMRLNATSRETRVFKKLSSRSNCKMRRQTCQVAGSVGREIRAKRSKNAQYTIPTF